MDKVLMKCGHLSNATLNGKPYCIICECSEVAEEKPSLEGRKARCWSCGRIEDSSYNLPFFTHRPNSIYDSFYDGCNGWD